MNPVHQVVFCLLCKVASFLFYLVHFGREKKCRERQHNGDYDQCARADASLYPRFRSHCGMFASDSTWRWFLRRRIRTCLSPLHF
mmetsp:Transcript_58098/g.155289  ORF Transcript_58098/g.155289 Transcript_58098/m.155289 type:complete len:85 (+) Transcript_58098:193-447(+)